MSSGANQVMRTMLTAFGRIYCELAEQYNLMDAVSNVPKRNALAEHLKEVVDTLEQKVWITCFQSSAAGDGRLIPR